MSKSKDDTLNQSQLSNPKNDNVDLKASMESKNDPKLNDTTLNSIKENNEQE